MQKYKTPKSKELRDPILKILADGKAHKRKEIIDAIAEHFNLSESDIRAAGYPIYSYCSRMLKVLEVEGVVKRRPDYGRGYWQIRGSTS